MKRVRWTLLLVALLGSLGAWLYFRWVEREHKRSGSNNSWIRGTCPLAANAEDVRYDSEDRRVRRNTP